MEEDFMLILMSWNFVQVKVNSNVVIQENKRRSNSGK